MAVAGVAAQWLGWRFRAPSILALLAFGLVIGPVFGWVKPSVILGETMSPTIGMAVAIIVFEGGLNLNLRELRSAGSGVGLPPSGDPGGMLVEHGLWRHGWVGRGRAFRSWRSRP